MNLSDIASINGAHDLVSDSSATRYSESRSDQLNRSLVNSGRFKASETFGLTRQNGIDYLIQAFRSQNLATQYNQEQNHDAVDEMTPAEALANGKI